MVWEWNFEAFFLGREFAAIKDRVFGSLNLVFFLATPNDYKWQGGEHAGYAKIMIDIVFSPDSDSYRGSYFQ